MSDGIVTSVLREGDECPSCSRGYYGSLKAITKVESGNLMCRYCGETFHDDRTFYCSHCADHHTQSETDICPDCGRPMELAP